MMSWNKKYFFTIVFVITAFSLVANTVSDSTIHEIFKTGHKFSISIAASGYSLMKYELPHYSNLNPKPTVPCNKCETYQKPSYSSSQFFDIKYLNLSYSLTKNWKVNIGISQIVEKIKQRNYNVDTIRINVIKITNIGTLENKYIGIYPSFIGSISNTKKGLFYTNLEVGILFDFIYIEKHYGSFESVDSIYSPYGTGIIVLDIKHFPEEPRTNKLSFNRISPFIHLYFEWYNKKKTFSFCLGSSVIFRSFYQLNNTAEFYKCYKITPIVLGISYHF